MIYFAGVYTRISSAYNWIGKNVYQYFFYTSHKETVAWDAFLLHPSSILSRVEIKDLQFLFCCSNINRGEISFNTFFVV